MDERIGGFWSPAAASCVIKAQIFTFGFAVAAAAAWHKSQHEINAFNYLTNAKAHAIRLVSPHFANRKL